MPDRKPEMNQRSFDLLRKYIEKHCGISLGPDKKYLLQTRLEKHVIESGSSSFGDFYLKLSTGTLPGLLDKIIDAITTNETLWFRDGGPWVTLRDHVLPVWAERVEKFSGQRFRIWSAACSTGQEPYSAAMVIDDYCRRHRRSALTPSQIEIVATDISPSAIFNGISGRYDNISMSRGLTGDWASFKSRYFRNAGGTFEVDSSIRTRVRFQRFNLQSSFASLGRFDLIMLRNVAIYFSSAFKREMFQKLALALDAKGFLFLGGSETVAGFTKAFERKTHGRSSYYTLNG